MRAEPDCERRTSETEYPLIFVVDDRFVTGIAIGYFPVFVTILVYWFLI